MYKTDLSRKGEQSSREGTGGVFTSCMLTESTETSSTSFSVAFWISRSTAVRLLLTACGATRSGSEIVRERECVSLWCYTPGCPSMHTSLFSTPEAIVLS